MPTAAERLEELENSQSGGSESGQISAADRLSQLENRDTRSRRWRRRNRATTTETPSATDLAQSFNLGMVNLINMPLDIVNMGLGLVGVPEIPGSDDFRQMTANLGLTAQPGEEAEGFLPRTMEIAGGSIIPAMSLLKGGTNVLTQGIPIARQTWAQRMGTAAAESPLTTIGLDLISSVGAGAGGEAIAQVTDDPTLIALGELAGGFSPAAVPLATTGIRAGGRMMKEAVIPFTVAGATPRAARRLQSLAADPQRAASRISDDSTLSPARQTEEPGLLSLEQKVLEGSPAAREAYGERLAVSVREAAEAGSDFGGERGRARDLLRSGRDNLVNLVEQRAAIASADAAQAISRLDPGATPRDISRAARQHIEQAYDEARQMEKQLWSAIDRMAPAEYTNAAEQYQRILSGRSVNDNPDDIPPYVRRALGGDSDLPDEVLNDPTLSALIDEDGNLPDRVFGQLVEQGVITPDIPSATFNDLQSLRSRILDDLRAARAERAPPRNKIRILSELQLALLDDMSDSGAEGVDAARAFSNALNTRFTEGAVGRLLGFERTGGRNVDPGDTLAQLMNGRASFSAINQLVNPTQMPDGSSISYPAGELATVKGQVEQFIKAQYLARVAEADSINARAHRTFISRMEEQGIFELYPTLRDELNGVQNLSQGAERLGVRAASTRRFAYNGKKSRAALYLEQPTQEAMSRVLRSDMPVPFARTLVRRMGGDQSAIQGMKSEFSDELMRMSRIGQYFDDGTPMYSGSRFSRLIEEYEPVARAFEYTGDEMARLRRTAETFRKAEARAGAAVDSIIDDTPGAIMDLIARWVGAQAGGHSGGNLGSGLVLAQAGSSRLRGILGKLTRDRATEMVVAAHFDPDLYRALLTRPDHSLRRQRQAADKLNTWLFGVATEEVD